MDDVDLDALLRSSAPEPSEAARETAVLLARQTRGVHGGATPLGGTRRRRRWVVAAVAAGALTVTGAGTLTAYQLGVPPFQTLEGGVGRTTTGIPVTYTNSLDRTVECLAFIEYRNLDAEQRNDIEQIAHEDSWEGYGQRVLDSLAIPDASPAEQNMAVGGVVSRDLWLAAHSAVPTMVYQQDSNGPVYNGSSLSCADAGGVDGRS